MPENHLGMPMKINGQRMIADLEKLRTFTDTPGEGVTRFSYSKMDQAARQYLFDQVKQMGGTIETDLLQNVRIGHPGNRAGKKSVVIGSHIDTVRNGGWLDGVYGVCAGLEVLRCLSAADLDCNLELAVFAEEEGSNFGSTMTGSKFITGKYQYDDLQELKTPQGISLGEVLGNPKSIDSVRWNFDEIKTMLELHIEQGPMLESEGVSLGIVESIFGMEVVEVEIKGTGNHAGATPMSHRRDALTAACRCILRAEELVCEDPDKITVATAGKVDVMPGCSNVIPEKVTFTLEVRDKDSKKIDHYMSEIIGEIKLIAARCGTTCSVTRISGSRPLKLSGEVAHTMDRIARQYNIKYCKIDSGAVHDACMIASYAETGMIFVPSIGGRSHVPEENTRTEDLIQGADFLLLTAMEQCRQ